ncbi:hypothetical protein EK904_009749 [Melospiza melodia maxima]|nr:hypothetical protein EK904_009749 [Melospiza melodia maxima]
MDPFLCSVAGSHRTASLNSLLLEVACISSSINMLKHGKDCLASLLLRAKDSETGFSSETSIPAATEYPKLLQTAFMSKQIVTSSTKQLGASSWTELLNWSSTWAASFLLMLRGFLEQVLPFNSVPSSFPVLVGNILALHFLLRRIKSLGPAAAIVVGALAVREGIALGVTLHALLLACICSHRKFPEQRLHNAKLRTFSLDFLKSSFVTFILRSLKAINPASVQIACNTGSKNGYTCCAAPSNHTLKGSCIFPTAAVTVEVRLLTKSMLCSLTLFCSIKAGWIKPGGLSERTEVVKSYTSLTEREHCNNSNFPVAGQTHPAVTQVHPPTSTNYFTITILIISHLYSRVPGTHKRYFKPPHCPSVIYAQKIGEQFSHIICQGHPARVNLKDSFLRLFIRQRELYLPVDPSCAKEKFSLSTAFELMGLKLNVDKTRPNIPQQFHTMELNMSPSLIPQMAGVCQVSKEQPAFPAPGSRLALVKLRLSPPKHRWCCPAFPSCCRCAAAAHSLLNNYLKWLCHLNRKEEYSHCLHIYKGINVFLLFQRFFSYFEAPMITLTSPRESNPSSWFSSSNIVRWISLSPPELESYLLGKKNSFDTLSWRCCHVTREERLSLSGLFSMKRL